MWFTKNYSNHDYWLHESDDLMLIVFGHAWHVIMFFFGYYLRENLNLLIIDILEKKKISNLVMACQNTICECHLSQESKTLYTSWFDFSNWYALLL